MTMLIRGFGGAYFSYDPGRGTLDRMDGGKPYVASAADVTGLTRREARRPLEKPNLTPRDVWAAQAPLSQLAPKELPNGNYRLFLMNGQGSSGLEARISVNQGKAFLQYRDQPPLELTGGLPTRGIGDSSEAGKPHGLHVFFTLGRADAFGRLVDARPYIALSIPGLNQVFTAVWNPQPV
jgi:hypothetical protein